MPDKFEVSAVIRGKNPGGGLYKNGVLIFNYQGPNDFDFAGGFFGADQWRIGRVTAGNWQTLASFAQSIDVETDYDVRVLIDGPTATLFVGGLEMVSHSFGQSLAGGQVGMGTLNAAAVFDNLLVQGVAGLPYAETFDEGDAEALLPVTGNWWVNPANRYRTAPAAGEDAISITQLDGYLPDNFKFEALIRAKDGGAGFFRNVLLIFDYKSLTDFKFAGGFVANDKWRIDHVSGSSWFFDETANGAVNIETDYHAELRIAGSTVTLLIDGEEKVSHSYGQPLSDGSVGVGTHRSFSAFDDLLVDVL